jgi:hypothetical protein
MVVGCLNFYFVTKHVKGLIPSNCIDLHDYIGNWNKELWSTSKKISPSSLNFSLGYGWN